MPGLPWGKSMYFAGVDLAWSRRNPSGVALLERAGEGARLLRHATLQSDGDILAWLDDHVGDDPALVAIDAPLVVPNEEGQRPAERQAGRLLRRYKAAPYPVNRTLLTRWSDDVRGETLAAMLEQRGFAHRPSIDRRERCRAFLEVYTHAAMIVFCSLDERLPYKERAGRSRTERMEAFRRLQRCLASLEDAEIPLLLPDSLLRRDVQELHGGALKRYEDVLDAVLCAYTACYAWRHPGRCMVLGDRERGYILTPVSPGMRRQLADDASG